MVRVAEAGAQETFQVLAAWAPCVPGQPRAWAWCPAVLSHPRAPSQSVPRGACFPLRWMDWALRPTPRRGPRWPS